MKINPKYLKMFGIDTLGNDDVSKINLESKTQTKQDEAKSDKDPDLL